MLLAAILALVSAFFYGARLAQRVERLSAENKRLIELAKKKEQTITSLEGWINVKEKSQKKVTEVYRARNLGELHVLYEEITGYREAADNNPK